MAITLAVRKLRQENHRKLEANLVYKQNYPWWGSRGKPTTKGQVWWYAMNSTTWQMEIGICMSSRSVRLHLKKETAGTVAQEPQSL